VVLLVADNEQKRSEEAKRILENPIFIEAINKISSEIYNDFINSDVQDSERRENAYKFNRVLNLVVMQIKSVMETGKIIKK
jgi:hypothetical protein